MTRAQQRHLLAGLLLLTSVVAGAAGLGCGQASIKTFAPCPTPTSLDITFRRGVLQVFVSADCTIGSNCHSKQNGGASGLILGGGNATPEEIYANLIAGGSQAQGGDVDVAVGTSAAQGLVLQKPLSTNPIIHTGGKAFGSETSPGYLTIFLWASNGALDNGTTGGCAP